MTPCKYCGTEDLVHHLCRDESRTETYAYGPCTAKANLVPLEDVLRVLQDRVGMVSRSGGDPSQYYAAIDIIRYVFRLD